MKQKPIKQDSMLGRRVRFSRTLKVFAISIFAFIGMFAFVTNPKASSIASFAIVLPFVVGGVTKKEAEMSDDEKGALNMINSQINKGIEEFAKNNLTAEGLGDVIMKALGSVGQEESPTGEFAKRMKELGKLPDIIKDMAKEIQGLKEKGLDLNGAQESAVSMAVKSALESDKFKDFASGRINKTSGKIRFDAKEMSMGSNYTGTILISAQSSRVGENPQPRAVHLRDIMMIERGDPNMPSLTYSQIVELDRNAAAVSENGVLPESAFKVEEVTENTRRIGTILFISKRMLKSLKWLQSWLTNRIPSQVLNAEDFQILNGDGTGDNLKGIMKYCPNFKTVLTAVVTGAAGSISAVESYDGGAKTKVTFTNPQSKINNGASITFAAFANAAYNAAFGVKKLTDREIVVDIAYTAQSGAQCAAATFSAGGEFADSVEDATIADALLAAQAYLTYCEYAPNGVALNPIDVFKILVLKDTQTRYLDIIKVVNGVLTIGGLSITKTTAIGIGKFVMGDFQMGASLTDFTALELEFAEDITTKRKNQVAIIVQEEVIMPVYNPYAFLQGDLAEVVTEIEKP